MDANEVLQLPILTIKEVLPLLQNASIIFAYKIVAVDAENRLFIINENKGLNVGSYLNKKMEFLIEITKGIIKYKDFDDPDHSPNTFTFRYMWEKRPKDYFIELKSLTSEKGSQSIEIVEDSVIGKSKGHFFLNNWGLNGLDIGIYQSKPLLNSSNGIFLLNEYEFEEDIGTFELGQEVYIRIEECYLRGIRPYVSPEEIASQPFVYFEGKEYTEAEWRKYSMGLSKK